MEFFTATRKLFQFSCGCKKFHYGRSFGFLVINMSNYGEQYETPCAHYKTLTFFHPLPKRPDVAYGWKPDILRLRSCT